MIIEKNVFLNISNFDIFFYNEYAGESNKNWIIQENKFSNLNG